MTPEQYRQAAEEFLLKYPFYVATLGLDAHDSVKRGEKPTRGEGAFFKAVVGYRLRALLTEKFLGEFAQTLELKPKDLNGGIDPVLFMSAISAQVLENDANEWLTRLEAINK